jgi:hypothetical protein
LSGIVIDPSSLAAEADLLHGPAVAVRVAKGDEPDVVENISVAAWAQAVLVEHLDLAGLHSSPVSDAA